MNNYKNIRVEIATIVILIALSTWWGILFFGFDSALEFPNLIWAASYQSIAIWGLIWGFIIAKRWGAYRSIIGKSILILSTGLLFQVFGQSVFSIYGLFLNREIPYPSLADVGFFGSIPFYIVGIIILSKTMGPVSLSRSFRSKPITILLPLIMLIVSYMFFLRNYVVDWSAPLQVILDFGYPFGQAVFVSLALLVYLLSKNLLGGIMRSRILIILIALIVQYIADFNFLFQFSNETWINGGYGDYLYLLAYFLMSYGLIHLGTAFNEIREN